MKHFAQRLGQLPDNFFVVFLNKISALKAAGQDVIRLDIGSPDMPPAPGIIQALAQSASRPDHHGYQSHAGPPGLKAAWAQMYANTFGVELDPEQEIVPLMGSKEGIFNLIMALIESGDVVLIPDPGYMTYTRGTIFAGGEPYYLPLLAENDYLPDLSNIPELIKTHAKVLWLNYPNNPTAATSPLEFFAEAVEFARQHDLLICHDAAYTQVTFDGYHAPSILQVPGAKEVTVEFNTLSKSYNMAGWRVGAACGNSQALRTLYKLKTNVDSGHFLPVMEAAITAMTGDQRWLVERNEVYQQRRDVVISHLHALGLAAKRSAASLYVWCPIPSGWTSLEFVEAALEGAHVSLTPGTIFGSQGEGFIRIALTEPLERISEAMQRFRNWMEK